jgi:hypothetical protein
LNRSVPHRGSCCPRGSGQRYARSREVTVMRRGQWLDPSVAAMIVRRGRRGVRVSGRTVLASVAAVVLLAACGGPELVLINR